ncbi:MAG: response regulator [Bryobacteraceae bacterium]
MLAKVIWLPQGNNMQSPSVLHHPCKILHIDDNVGDSVLLKYSLLEIPEICFTHVATFDDALHLLRKHQLAEKFNLIIMDWHIPPYSGEEMLAFLKADPNLRAIPVIVLTGMLDPSAVKKAYEARASCVLRIPVKRIAFPLRCE